MDASLKAAFRAHLVMSSKLSDAHDARLSRELANPLMPKAVAAPVTLATIGLEWDEVKQIARELRREREARSSK